MTQVLVRTGSRLHFGLILGSPADGWEFGGAGLMVSQPGWKFGVSLLQPPERAVHPQDCPDRIVGGSADTVERIKRLLQRLRSHQPTPPLQITLDAEIPPHAGLGSGTQLSLAVTAAVGWLVSGRLPPPADQLAAISGRSERSAIGTAGFDHGGFLVDRGRSADGTRVQRFSIPDHWRFLLVRPLHTQGLSGAAEQTWFQGRREMPRELATRLGSLIESRLIPAIADGDALAFAESLETYGDAVGGFYTAAQGGTFSHPAIRQLVAGLRQQGIRGAAQSSWGPGICIPVGSASAAERLLQVLPTEIDGCRLEATVTEPLNTGAAMTRAVPPDVSTAWA